MKITFLGVGEACDEKYPNTSVWLKWAFDGAQKSVLLDCGFTVPPQFWRQTANPNDLDAVWISHFHGDHFFGVPALLLRFWEQKREKPLVVVGPTGVKALILQTMQLAYPSFAEKLKYPMEFVETEPGQEIECAGLKWSFALNIHGQTSLAVRLEGQGHSVFYSGDGLCTQETLALAEDCDLVVHEAFRLEGQTPGHGSVRECIEFARNAKAKMLALVHVQRDERRERRSEILERINEVKDLSVFLPDPGDVVELVSKRTS